MTEETGTTKRVSETKKRKLNEKSAFTISRVQNRTLMTEKEKMLSSSLKISHSRREPKFSSKEQP